MHYCLLFKAWFYNVSNVFVLEPNTECPPFTMLKDELETLVSDGRPHKHLPGEVVEINCGYGYVLEDKEGDYVYECLEGGAWNNTALPVCLFGL